MGKHYSHLDIDERYELYRLTETGIAQKEIAKFMKRSESAISRELRRNCLPRGGYRPASADRIALSRRRRLSRIECLIPLGEHIRDRLAMGWSPEQIVGRLRREEAEHIVSVETIYRFIYRPKIRTEKLYRFLPRSKAVRGRRYFKKRREPLTNRRSIHDRPACANDREEFGHWEGDLMQFRTQRGNLLTLYERKTRFTITAPLKTKTAEETTREIVLSLMNLPKNALKTITFDNGGEFSQPLRLEENLGLEVYFCDPHSPWQRGGIENTNGLLRRDMPRKSDIQNYTLTDIDEITWSANSTPRKCLGFMTPAEAFLLNLQNCT